MSPVEDRRAPRAGPRRRGRQAAGGGAALGRDDLERLCYAAGTRAVDPQRSLFGPDSITWRVNREAVLLLGGGRALLLQIAHPLVAAGVAAHSEFERAPLARLRRTLDLTLTTVFGSAAEARTSGSRHRARAHPRPRHARR